MGKISAVLIILSAVIAAALLAFIYKNPELDWSSRLLANGAIFISFATFALTAITSASSILLSWRSDLRQSREDDLKVKQLELQIRELQAKVELEQNRNQNVIRTLPDST
jgi:hypothetical protein